MNPKRSLLPSARGAGKGISSQRGGRKNVKHEGEKTFFHKGGRVEKKGMTNTNAPKNTGVFRGQSGKRGGRGED